MHFGGIGYTQIFICVVLIFGLAIIPAKIAEKKGYSYWGFYIFGVFLWIVALIVSLCVSDRNDKKIGNADELLKYKQLFDSGTITQNEFDAKKAELMK